MLQYFVNYIVSVFFGWGDLRIRGGEAREKIHDKRGHTGGARFQEDQYKLKVTGKGLSPGWSGRDVTPFEMGGRREGWEKLDHVSDVLGS